MPFTGSVSLTARYTSPGPTTNAPVFSVSSIEYTALTSGFVDIPEATADATVFSIPFGEVSDVKGIVLQNNTAQQLNVRYNGAVADEYSIPPGGICVPLFGATASLDDPITSVEVVTTAVVAADGNVAFLVLGDDPTP